MARPGTNGHIVLGGTHLPSDSSYCICPVSREAARILSDCFKLGPRLAGSSNRHGEDGQTGKIIQVLAHTVGVAACARGRNARVEAQLRTLEAAVAHMEAVDAVHTGSDVIRMCGFGGIGSVEGHKTSLADGRRFQALGGRGRYGSLPPVSFAGPARA